MQFSTMYTELADRLGAYDPAVSTDLTKLKRWINMGQMWICGKRLWPFMLAEEIVQTVTDITTGTVSINASDTALTFSSAPAVSVANRYIKLSTSDDWYKITAHTAASTSATISPAYVGTSNLTGGTYTVRKLLYSTSTPLIQILDMKQLSTPTHIIGRSPTANDFFLPLHYDTGTVYNYIMSSPDATGSIQWSYILPPSDVINVYVRGIKALTDLSSDSDTPLIPTPWQDAIINVAAFHGFQSLDDTRATAELEAAELRIADMARNLAHDQGRQRVMQTVDENLGELGWNLPPYIGRDL